MNYFRIEYDLQYIEINSFFQFSCIESYNTKIYKIDHHEIINGVCVNVCASHKAGDISRKKIIYHHYGFSISIFFLYAYQLSSPSTKFILDSSMYKIKRRSATLTHSHALSLILRPFILRVQELWLGILYFFFFLLFIASVHFVPLPICKSVVQVTRGV